MSGVLQKPEQSFWGRLFKAKTGVVRGDPGTKRAAVATILFRSVPLRWVTCGSLVGCCWDLPCWLPSFEVSVVEPLAHCTTVTQSGVCVQNVTINMRPSCPSLALRHCGVCLHSQRSCGNFWEEPEHLSFLEPTTQGAQQGCVGGQHVPHAGGSTLVLFMFASGGEELEYTLL